MNSWNKNIVKSFVLASLLYSPQILFSQKIAAGSCRSLAICNNGDVIEWNCYSQDTAFLVNGISNVIAVACGDAHSIALKNDGTVWSWGSNYDGQLGDSTSVFSSSIPVKAKNLTGIIAISAGGEFSIALKNDGTVWAWGKNRFGELGTTSVYKSNYPIKVNGLSRIVAIDAGGIGNGQGGFSLALKNDGTVWSWGCKLGLGGGTSATPLKINNLSAVTSISAGGLFALALKNDGTVWSWGFNTNGELGIGQSGNIVWASDTPVKVINLTGTAKIAAGAHHSLAIKSDGTLWAWGSNYLLALGTPYPSNRLFPTLANVGNGTPVEIAAGANRSVGIYNGSVFKWGETTYMHGISIQPVKNVCTTTTGIGDIDNNSDWSIYPNPATDELFINLPDNTAKLKSVVIYNSLGEKVKIISISNPDSFVEIDIAELPEGIYFLETINPKNQISIKKFIKL